MMMIWQGPERNEWATAIGRSLTMGSAAPTVPPEQNPFSLADPSFVQAILKEAGFIEIDFAEVQEPVYYGPDVDTAYGIVRSMKRTSDILAALTPGETESALERLRIMLAEQATNQGVLFASRAWIVTARRRGSPDPAGDDDQYDQVTRHT